MERKDKKARKSVSPRLSANFNSLQALKPFCFPESEDSSKENVPTRKRVSFSKRIEIQEFASLVNECYSAIQSSSSGSSAGRPSGVTQISNWSLASATTTSGPQVLVEHTGSGDTNASAKPQLLASKQEEDVDMDMSLDQSAHVSAVGSPPPCSYPPKSLAEVSMDVSMEPSMLSCTELGTPSSLPQQPSAPPPLPQDPNEGIDETMEISVVAEADSKIPAVADAVNEMPTQELDYVSMKRSVIDSTPLQSPPPKLQPEGEEYCAPAVLQSPEEEFRSDEEEALDGLPVEKTSLTTPSASPSASLVEVYQAIRPTAVTFAPPAISPMLRLQQRQAKSRETLFSTSAVKTPLKRSSVAAQSSFSSTAAASVAEEFSLTGGGGGGGGPNQRFRSTAVGKLALFHEGALANYDNSNRIPQSIHQSLDSLKDSTPMLAREFMTLEDFLTHVLALKCAITPDLIEAELKRSPLLASPALASVSPADDEVLQRVRKIENDLLVETILRANALRVSNSLMTRGSYSHLLFSEELKKIKDSDGWWTVLRAFNRMPILEKLEEVKRLRDLYYDRCCPAAIKSACSPSRATRAAFEEVKEMIRERTRKAERSRQENADSLKWWYREEAGWRNPGQESERLFLSVKEKLSKVGPQTDAVLREAEELRLRRESRSSDAGNEGGTRVAEPAQEGSGIPLEALTGLGASLVPFGRRVPHQDVTAACRRLFSASSLRCLSAASSTYAIRSFFGAIQMDVQCENTATSIKTDPSTLEIAGCFLSFTEEPSEPSTTNQVAKFAVDRINFSSALTSLVGRSLEDAVDLLEFLLMPWASLACNLRALWYLGVLADLEAAAAPASTRSAPTGWSPLATGSLADASITINATLVPTGVTAVLQVTTRLPSVGDIDGHFSVDAVELTDVTQNINLETLRHHVRANSRSTESFVDLHEKLFSLLHCSLRSGQGR